MVVLDGAWICGDSSSAQPSLELWAETDGVPMTPATILDWLQRKHSFPRASESVFQASELPLQLPLNETGIALLLELEQADDLQLTDPLKAQIDDIRRTLSLLRQGSFLPGIACIQEGGLLHAVWLPESAEPQSKLVETLVNDWVKRWIAPLSQSEVLRQWKDTPVTPIEHWVHGLFRLQGSLSEAKALEWIEEEWQEWIRPGDRSLAPTERLWLRLEVPASGSTLWTLSYLLGGSSADEPMLNALDVWSDALEQPVRYESLLRALTRASEIVPEIRVSLEREAAPAAAILTTERVHQLLLRSASPLRALDCGILVPSGLRRSDRIGMRLTLNRSQYDSNRAFGVSTSSFLSFEALIRFQYDAVVNGMELPRELAEQWLQAKAPLVEFKGEWFELAAEQADMLRKWLGRSPQGTWSASEAVHRLLTPDSRRHPDVLPVTELLGAEDVLPYADLLREPFAKELLEPPNALRAELRPYQQVGFTWMTRMTDHGLGVCLADDMGLGKTVQLIAVLVKLKQSGQLRKPALLLCPTSIVGNWQRELARFAPDLRLIVHYGQGRANSESSFRQELTACDLVITTYSTAQRDETLLTVTEWELVAFDEAQHLKNRRAKQSRAARSFLGTRRIALTGTPLENRLGELWSLMDLLNPGYLGSEEQFRLTFAAPIERKAAGWEQLQKELQLLIRPFILRRLKSDPEVAPDLPTKEEHKEYCMLSPEQAFLYQEYVDQMMDRVNEATGMKRRSYILSSITKLKQICNDPAHYRREALLRTGRSGKLQRLSELLLEIVSQDGRVVVFTQYAYMAKLLRDYCARLLEEDTLLLHGSVPKQQRDELIRRFQDDPDAPRVFVLSLKTGGFGLNLTRATHVIHYDRWWNPAVENQATDRVHRIGQEKDVLVYKLITIGTLEERIDELMESKKMLADELIGGGESWLTELQTEELHRILQLRDRLLLQEDEEE